jgi:hypothetical protein
MTNPIAESDDAMAHDARRQHAAYRRPILDPMYNRSGNAPVRCISMLVMYGPLIPDDLLPPDIAEQADVVQPLNAHE